MKYVKYVTLNVPSYFFLHPTIWSLDFSMLLFKWFLCVYTTIIISWKAGSLILFSLAGLLVGGLANVSNTETSIRFSSVLLLVSYSLYLLYQLQLNWLIFLISWCCLSCRAWFNFHEEFFFLFLLPPIILYPAFDTSKSFLLFLFYRNIDLKEIALYISR